MGYFSQLKTTQLIACGSIFFVACCCARNSPNQSKAFTETNPNLTQVSLDINVPGLSVLPNQALPSPKNKVKIELKNGQAYVSGIVNCEQERQRVLGLARSMYGITKINDNLKISEQKSIDTMRSLEQEVPLYEDPSN